METKEEFENKVRRFILLYAIKNLNVKEYLHGYQMFENFNDFSNNIRLKSALAKILIETQIEDIEEYETLDIFENRRKLKKYINY